MLPYFAVFFPHTLPAVSEDHFLDEVNKENGGRGGRINILGMITGKTSQNRYYLNGIHTNVRWVLGITPNFFLSSFLPPLSSVATVETKC